MAATLEGPPVTLLHITDTHLFAQADGRMHGVATWQSLRAVLDHAMQSTQWPPAGVLVTGDIVHDDSQAAYERFRWLLEPLELPVYCLPGNHDIPELMQKSLGKAPFQYLGNVDLDDWLLMLLDTHLPGVDAGQIGMEQLVRLAETLESRPDKHVLLCTHHHSVPIGSEWLDQLALNDAALFQRIVATHPQVRGVISGHVHQTSDQTVGAVRYLSTPSTSAQFSPGKASFAADNREPGLRWLNLHADGSIQTRVERIAPDRALAEAM